MPLICAIILVAVNCLAPYHGFSSTPEKPFIFLYMMRRVNPFLRIFNAIPIPTWIPILIVAMPTLWWSMSMLLFNRIVE